jgi:hypothetical protein
LAATLELARRLCRRLLDPRPRCAAGPCCSDLTAEPGSIRSGYGTVCASHPAPHVPKKQPADGVGPPLAKR